MQVTIVHEVTKCRDCPHVSNSSKEHDDPYTSEPNPLRWYCRHPAGFMHLRDAWVIHPDCPEMKKGKR